MKSIALCWLLNTYDTLKRNMQGALACFIAVNAWEQAQPKTKVVILG
jgi:hypothetical protein